MSTVTDNHCPSSRTKAGPWSGPGCSVLSCHSWRCSLYCWTGTGSFCPCPRDPRTRLRVSRIGVCCLFCSRSRSGTGLTGDVGDLRSYASSASLMTRSADLGLSPCRCPANFPSARFHLQFSMWILVCCGTKVSSCPGRNCHFLAPQTPQKSAWDLSMTSPWRPCRR